MVGILETFRALLSVTGEADFRLRFFREHGILRGVDRMTARAGDARLLHLAAVPVHPLTVLVAGQTGLVAHAHGRNGKLAF